MNVLDVLYVTDERAALKWQGGAVRIVGEPGEVRRFPLLGLEQIVCFGAISISPALLQQCAASGCAVVLLNARGRFQARVQGPVRGNVLLRVEQIRALDNAQIRRDLATSMVLGKIANARTVLLRAARENSDPAAREVIGAAADRLRTTAAAVPTADVDTARGLEGDAARTYFEVFDRMTGVRAKGFRLETRERRPPRSAMNALLSFIYTLLTSDVTSAVETAGLDPQVGFLHVLRPGRPGLGLDLVEELRAPFADRLALSLVNRGQLTRGDFATEEGGAVSLTDEGRRTTLRAYAERRRQEVAHPLLKEKVPWAIIPHIQARILARRLRADIPHYIPFLSR
jgi:CRISPR-associated protein Cas1